MIDNRSICDCIPDSLNSLYNLITFYILYRKRHIMLNICLTHVLIIFDSTHQRTLR